MKHRAIPEGVKNLYHAIMTEDSGDTGKAPPKTKNPGTYSKTKKTHAQIICIPKTNDSEELAAIYTAADFFVNPTHEDNYPTVNLEAVACETNVITYDVGGAGETVEKLEVSKRNEKLL